MEVSGWGAWLVVLPLNLTVVDLRTYHAMATSAAEARWLAPRRAITAVAKRTEELCVIVELRRRQNEVRGVAALPSRGPNAGSVASLLDDAPEATHELATSALERFEDGTEELEHFVVAWLPAPSETFVNRFKLLWY